MNNKIIHIPHSSKHIPKEYMYQYRISYDEIIKEIDIMTDEYVDLLIEDYMNIVKFEYSRIFCDVERFDNENEIMNSIGMGILYENSHKLEKIRNVDKENEIMEFYYEHHNKLNINCKNILEKYNNSIILDLHSYSDDALPYEIYKLEKRPDLCIGIDDYHFNKNQFEELIYIVKDFGINFEINQPFKGCLIPSDYYLKDKNVSGYMLEFKKGFLKNNIQKSKLMIKQIIENL